MVLVRVGSRLLKKSLRMIPCVRVAVVACGRVCAAQMSSEALAAVPPDATDCPYQMVSRAPAPPPVVVPRSEQPPPAKKAREEAGSCVLQQGLLVALCCVVVALSLPLLLHCVVFSIGMGK